MTNAVLGAIATTLILTTQVVDAKGKKHKGKQSRHASIAQFNRVDTNEDGELSLDELLASISTKTAKVLEHKDTDDDGFLSFEEATSKRTRDFSAIADDLVTCVADAKIESGNDLIQDLNADKFLSASDKFANTDTSGDEHLDAAELEAAQTAKITQMFESVDTDDSDSISEEEYNLHKQQRMETRKAIKTCVESLTDENDI